MEKDYIQLPPMPSDTPTELVGIVWIYARMEEPEKIQILDFIQENIKHGTNGRERKINGTDGEIKIEAKPVC